MPLRPKLGLQANGASSQRCPDTQSSKTECRSGDLAQEAAMEDHADGGNHRQASLATSASSSWSPPLDSPAAQGLEAMTITASPRAHLAATLRTSRCSEPSPRRSRHGPLPCRGHSGSGQRRSRHRAMRHHNATHALREEPGNRAPAQAAPASNEQAATNEDRGTHKRLPRDQPRAPN